VSQDLSRFLSPASFLAPALPVGAGWAEHVPFVAWLAAAERPALAVAPAGAAGGMAALLASVARQAGFECLVLVDGAGMEDAGGTERGGAGLGAVDGEAKAADGWADAEAGRLMPLQGAPVPGTVDLMLVEGEAVLAGRLDWLSPRAVVLLRLPAAMARSPHEAFRFRHGGGLLVLATEAAASGAALRKAAPAVAAEIRDAYARLGGHLTTRAQLLAARATLVAGRPATRAVAPAALAMQLDIAQRRATSLGAQVLALGAQLHAAQTHIRIVEQSTSWRLTAPLRRVLHRLPAGRSGLRRALRLGWWTVTLQLPARLAERRQGPLLIGGEAGGGGTGGTPDWPPPLALREDAERGPQAARTGRTDAEAGAEAWAVGVVVCVHNAPEETRRCLDALARHGRAPWLLVVVDDGSGADTRALLDTHPAMAGATLIRHEAALGYTRAANAGLRAAQGAIVVLLNSDTVVTAGWLDALARAFDADPRCAVVGPLSNTASWQSVPLLSEGGDWATNSLPDGVTVDEAGRMVAGRRAVHPALPFINGFCFAVRREALDAVGLLDEANFPEGYGEENDWCVRARIAGWTLRVADDCYVWHAQSRSFSHERRLRLAEQARRAIGAKYDARVMVDEPAAFCRHSLALHGVREWVGHRFEREQVVAQGRRWSGARVAFVLPVAAEGGGANVVLQEAEALGRMGVAVTLLNLAANACGAGAAYPEVESWRYEADEAALRAHVLAGGYDAVVATAQQSAFWLPLQSEARARMGYYVQDYEPLFYDPLGPDHALARLSYQQDPARAVFTKSAWNREVLLREVGVEATPIGPSVDVDRFRAVDRLRYDEVRPTLRVCAMVRPSSERRGPEATWRMMAGLAHGLGRGVECHVFGCDDADLAGYRARHPGAVRNHGRLRRSQVAAMFREMDVFVDLSSYQAMGLTLLEAMSAGLVAIGPERGGAGEFVTDGVDGFLVPTADGDAAREVVRQLGAGDLDMAGVRRGAVAAAALWHPERAALAMLGVLLP
jgi:GT2 family glycosyltransferase/glycosyltransferase involved in cell wall biosynthesis